MIGGTNRSRVAGIGIHRTEGTDMRIQRSSAPLRLKAVAPALLAAALAGNAHAQMGSYPMGNMIPKVSEESVSKITDGELTCEQLYAEYGYLEGRIAQLPKVDGPAEIAKMQQEMMASMGSGGSVRMVGGLLNQVPGGSLISSLASSASAAATRAKMQKQMKAQTDAATKYVEVETQRQPLQVRKTRVMNLFTERSCKVSTLDMLAIKGSTERLIATKGESSFVLAVPVEMDATNMNSAPTLAADPGIAMASIIAPATMTATAIVTSALVSPAADPAATFIPDASALATSAVVAGPANKGVE